MDMMSAAVSVLVRGELGRWLVGETVTR